VVKNDRRQLLHGHPYRRVFLTAAMLTAVLFLNASPIATDAPTTVAIQSKRAQTLLDGLRSAMGIPAEVQLAIVIQNPLVFSVDPVDRTKSHFVLSMDFSFLLMLEDDELRAALAHELGHVWIFTHHPYLQTERLANTIGLRVVDRGSFERVYRKLWAYEGTPGVPMDQLLGPAE
jgi:hypothetical protein